MSEAYSNAQIFVATSEFHVSEDDALNQLVEHRAWSKAAYDAGIILFSGRQDPPSGGVIVFRSADRDTAERFIASDPFAQSGVAAYQVISVIPTSFPWRRQDFDAFLTAPVNALEVSAD